MKTSNKWEVFVIEIAFYRIFNILFDSSIVSPSVWREYPKALAA